MSEPRSWNRTKKRVFDLSVCILAGVVWVPMLIFLAALIWCCEGRPIFYVSDRRVFGKKSIRLLKFRTMVRNADKIANRDTVPVEGVRFLNLPIDSPLYTPVGRLIERFHLTELPQLLHIVSGSMSFIGNRPLPENVIACLLQEYPDTEDRFLARAGLTGPVQLVGRTKVSDEERLRLETEYCRLCAHSYSVVLDFTILSRTVLSVLGIQRFLHVEEVFRLIRNQAAPVGAGTLVSGSQPASVGLPLEP
jgi:lipopolysaccharide/colanic/teichoic acid biosynthesis glycosyltransferase